MPDVRKVWRLVTRPVSRTRGLLLNLLVKLTR